MKHRFNHSGKHIWLSIKCLCLVLVLLISPLIISAKELNAEQDFACHMDTSYINDSTIEIFSNIPVFMTGINVMEATDNTQLYAEINASIGTQLSNRASSISPAQIIYQTNFNNQGCSQIRIIADDYYIAEIPTNIKSDLLHDPLFSGAILQFCEMAEQGINIAYINCYLTPLTTDNAMLTSNTSVNSDPNTEEYWESYCNYLGTYQGYKFLYTEVSAALTTDEAQPSNVTPSFNWGSFLYKTLKSVTTADLDGIPVPALLINDLILNILGSAETPLSITLSEGSQGYIRTWVSGAYYIRTVMIQDKLDRISGNAYYPWAYTYQTILHQGMRAMMPVSYRTSTSYNYKERTGLGLEKATSTPGFHGNPSFYSSVIEYYEDYIMGYCPYRETLDITEIAMSII